jgi:preprotein translocase subunit SecE
VQNNIMANLVTYIQESFQEVRDKVSWPSFGELLTTTNYVVLASAIFAMVIWGVDILVEKLVGLVY